MTSIYHYMFIRFCEIGIGVLKFSLCLLQIQEYEASVVKDSKMFDLTILVQELSAFQRYLLFL